ncbi:GNAT family N-acetyltransferase [Pseudomonas sp. CCI3.1]|uniref:GNAT family N-acetyltransferase n=1 Tax=Pseudomonas sp. CCI3.1 TaxID=3048618 RepID=UPI002AB4EADC|nr:MULTISPECIES: GNAT family N-acetyltransferase [unclassified Pseudomonas]MDY7580197.1 GNAT family N-acetyltransferase [Pseudomonas sp. CCI3.1]MEB0068332.1 GNAT family N-acetyltransferase [Pseudomonas sp. CCI3.1]MEB0072889.1 GNAT family N-acetyltransferase [Pseudomonas sp. CCI1.4]
MSALHTSACIYRPMTQSDLPAAHGLSSQLDWPHRLEDWGLLHRVFKGFVATVDDRLIGTAFACPQGNFATIGLVVVNPDFQGQGIGRLLMELALDACQPGTPILNASVAGAPLYLSQGFVEFGTIEQRQGLARAVALEPLAEDEHLRALCEQDQVRQLALANAGSGLDRSALFAQLHDTIEHTAGIETDGQLQAFALLRRAGRGHCIGPVIAQNTRQARHLITTLLAQIPNQFVRIDVPMDSGLCEWLTLAGLEPVDRVTQMALGSPPQPNPLVRQFALVSQAIG